MCGRYTLRTAPAEFWPADQLALFVPRYNIAPSQPVAAVRQHDGRPQLAQLRWGLIPSWSKDEKIGYRTINARAESITQKPAFRSAFQCRRCLILADGFYEWKPDGKKKQPYFIHLHKDRPFAFAGLWERWLGPHGNRLQQPIESCTIITTVPNQLTSQVHDRMPVILHPQDHASWLDPEFEDLDRLQALLKPFDADAMESYPVGSFVNKPSHDGAECVTRVAVQKRLI